MEDKKYKFISISAEGDKFDEELTKASVSGWEVAHINSFPVQKPDYIKNSMNIIIIYTAVLRKELTEEA